MIFQFINYCLIFAAATILLLNIVLFTEIFAACSSKRTPIFQGEHAKRVAVLVPAHDEENVILSTLRSLKQDIDDDQHIIVIADNCTDNTAEIAHSAGVKVIERADSDRRGKGYALDFGIKSLQSAPPDVVIMIDADSLITRQSIQKLVRQVSVTSRPAQAVYLMEKPQQPSLKDQISAFAFKVKNLVRPMGLEQFQLPCTLTGTGMAFPWEIISSIDLANGEIVEDMKLGLDLTIADHAPLLCRDALIWGQLPAKANASVSQRKRWEHGHLQILLRYVPQLFWQALAQQRWELAVVGLDLAIPPLSLLVMLWAGLLTIGIIFGAATQLWVSSLLTAGAGVILLLSMMLAWIFFGREELSFKRLLLFPLYLVWKLPLYFSFLIRPQQQWVRTDRDAEDL